jgi:alkyldihydroxyacetonephosphate synthase
VGDIPNSADALDLRAASRDLWPRDTLAWWQGVRPPDPDRVYWPDNEAQVQSLLDHAHDEKQAVIVYGAGSGVGGGARGVSGSIVLDTKRLDHIGPLDTERWTVRVQAGVIGQHLEDWLAERGFTLGHSPSSIVCSTVGGWAAARSAGQFSSRYGVFEDMVLQMRVATPGKGTVTVGMDGDAPDAWMAILLGSEGTLGVITEVTLRVMPIAKARWLRGYAFPSVETALTAMRQLMQAETWPAVLRLYDPVDTRIGGKTKPKSDKSGVSALTRLRGALARIPGMERRMLALPLSLPRLLNTLADIASGEVLLIVGWEGEPDVVDALVEAGRSLLEAGGRDLGAAPGERWFDSRHAVSYKLMPLFRGGAFADTMEVGCRWSDVPKVYAAVRNAVRGHALVMAHMSHLYPEGGSLYFSFAGHGDQRTYDALWQRALDAVLASGATTTHHHGVGRLKQRHAMAEVGAAAVGWQRLRDLLDPHDVLGAGLLFCETVIGELPHFALHADDGLVDVPVGACVDDRRALAHPHDLRWPWEEACGLPRWQRLAWQTTWIDVRGIIGGEPVHLGRGPRSASGSDLRPTLVEEDPLARVTVATVATEGRWMGRATVEHPWVVARALLRHDLRPSVLTVVDGVLLVGFHGVAGRALGALASGHVPGGLVRTEWVMTSLPSGRLVACDAVDPAVVHVTHQCAWRRVDE